MPTLARLLLLFASLLLGPLVVMADDLPENTYDIESLTVEQAQKLVAKFAGPFEVAYGPDLYLDRLKALDAKTAKALADFKGTELSIGRDSGLTKLDAETAKALAEFAGWELNLTIGSDSVPTKLDVETAKALAKSKAAVLRLFCLIDAETAEALAEYKGQDLTLKHLSTLDAQAAKALAAFEGGSMGLYDLKTLDAETAKALAGFKGSLTLEVLTPLDANAAKAIADVRGTCKIRHPQLTLDLQTAKALAACHNWDGHLLGLTAFESPDSVAIAKALATRKNQLSLRDLKKISPNTLRALLEKEGVGLQIPPIETLEFIQEPDGSPFRAFVKPEGFQAWQKQQKQPQPGGGVF